MSKTKLQHLTKEDLLKINEELMEKNKNLMQRLKEKELIIQKHIISYWSWDKIKLEFDAIENIEQALAFLDKLLAEKAICTNKECPVFPALHEIDVKKFILTQYYHSVFDIKTAKIRFKTNKTKYNNWLKLYWEIRFMLNHVYNEIKQIGIPNETKKGNFFETRGFLHQKHVELMEMCDDVRMNIDPSAPIKQTLEADKQMLSSEDYDDYGNDIFKERRKELAEEKKMQGGS